MGCLELLYGGYFRKVFNVFVLIFFMEVFNLEDMLKRENFKVLVVNGDPRMFYRGNVRRFMEDGYDVSEIDFEKFTNIRAFASRFFELSPDYALLNFKNPDMANKVGDYLSLKFRPLPNGDFIMAAIQSSDYFVLSKSIDLAMARKYWEYDFESFAERVSSKHPYNHLTCSLDELQHRLTYLWRHPFFTCDEDLWESFIASYGLAVGQGNQQELVARLEGIYSLIYGEDLKSAVYHSDGSANEFTDN